MRRMVAKVMTSQPGIEIEVGKGEQIAEGEILELKRQEMGAKDGMGERSVDVDDLESNHLLVVPGEAIQVPHGVELEGKLQNDSPDVVVSQAELPQGGGSVIVQDIHESIGMGSSSNSRELGGDPEALMQEMGNGSAEAGADMGNGNGTGFHNGAEEGGGDDLGVHAEVVGEEEGEGEGLGKRGAAVGRERESVEKRKRELECLEQYAGGACGRRGIGAHPLCQLVEGSHQLHHHLPSCPALLQRSPTPTASRFRVGQAEPELPLAFAFGIIPNPTNWVLLLTLNIMIKIMIKIKIKMSSNSGQTAAGTIH